MLLVRFCCLQEDVQLFLILLWLIDGCLEVCVHGGNGDVEVIQGGDQGRQVPGLDTIPGHACVYVDGYTQTRSILESQSG